MGRRILIIDDEANIRRVVRLALEAADYEVREAADGERGLQEFQDGAGWDAVLLDQKMPGLDGLETLRQIRERCPGARVIMLTAFASIELAVDAMKLGATDFIRKPMTPEVLRNAVQAAISKPIVAERAAAVAAVRSSVPDSSPALIDRMTLNGFHFAPEAGEAHRPVNERSFIVTDPNGRTSQVTVVIGAEMVGYVERMIRRSLPAENSFWTRRAAKALAEYFWNEGRVPPGGRLLLSFIDREQLAIAERWNEG
jgi:DNA-binding response OmpR family regulator